MKLMSFPEINDLENGQQIPAFQGTVKKVLDQRTGVGEFGPWTLQTLFLQDEHAHEITVTWTCPDPFDAGVEGQTLYFESGRDKKEQLVGLKREIRKKNGKTYESVKVDDRAKVKVLNSKVPDHDDHGIAEVEESGGGSTYKKVADPDWPEAPATAPESSVRPQNHRSSSSALDERQRAIIRQHSQSMALEVLKLKVTLNELTVEDLTPAKLRSLADYFDTDVLEASK